MSSFTYTKQKDFVGASKADFEPGAEHICVQPDCGRKITIKTEICPYCKGNPFCFNERALTKEQLSNRRAVQRKEESH